MRYESTKKAQRKYCIKCIVTKTIGFNKNTDNMLLEHVLRQHNFSKYVKGLILDDMLKNSREQKCEE